MTDRTGFTAIEMLVVVSILVVVVSVAFPSLSRFYTSQQVIDVDEQITDAIRTARARANAQVNGMSHGVYFAEDGFTLFQGESFANRSTTLDIARPVTQALRIETTFANGELIFMRGQTTPQATGTVLLFHSAGPGKSIHVLANGQVEQTE